MKLKVRYPALVTTKEARPRRVVGWVDDVANIREVSRSDAPVALVMNCKFQDTEYRYYEDKLYMAAPWTALERQKLGLYEHMCGKAFDQIMAQKAPLPKALGMLKTEWSKTRIPAFHRDFYTTNTDKTWADLKPITHFKHDETEIMRWHEVAQNYISQLLIIDERLWTPVEEPVVMVEDTFAGPRIEENDLSIFRNAYGTADILRTPYGTSYKEDVYGYWEPRFDILSIEQTIEEYGDYINKKISLIIPEAFTNNISHLQIDRAVRLCAKFYFEHETASRIPDDRREYARMKQALKRVSKHKPQECDTQAQAIALRNVSEHLEEDITPIRACPEEDRLFLLDLVSRAIDRWEDRTITVGTQPPSFHL
jgi:hypothetical protein